MGLPTRGSTRGRVRHSFRLSFKAIFSAACLISLLAATLLLFRPRAKDSAYGPVRGGLPIIPNPNHGISKPGDVLIVGDDRLHILLPSTNADVNLCKTLLTARLLGYPTPGLIAWNTTYDHPNQLAGGSHLAKIFRVLDYLEALPSTSSTDLILMMDAYDIWFQLPPTALVSRFHRINAAADARNSRRFPPSFDIHSIRQTVVFGAGKRCAPNQLHTVACYPIPASPLPSDLYGDNTDTVIGRNKYTSLRQRYLNSGYVMGRVVDLLPLFRAAAFEVQHTPDSDPDVDNGSGGSDFLYHGSDQSIFNTLLGRQEYQRERRRRAAGGQPIETHMEGTVIADVLSPPFEHETWEQSTKHGLPDGVAGWEFGLGLDYFSDLGHQTVNAETDAKWLRFDAGPLDTGFPGKNRFDCRAHLDRDAALADLRRGDVARPLAALPHRDKADDPGWEDVSLYANLCLGTVPVMVHHNGDKGARERRWPDMWFQPWARPLLAAVAADTAPGNRDGVAWTDTQQRYGWEALCGASEPDILLD